MAVVTQLADRDTYLSADQPTTAKDGTNLIAVAGDDSAPGEGVLRWIAHWDVTAINAQFSAITQVRLIWAVLNDDNANSFGTINRMTETAWTEAATWNTKDGTNAWASAGGDFTTTGAITTFFFGAGGEHATIITALFNDAVANRSGNLDLLVKLSDESNANAHFWSGPGEEGGTYPYIEVTGTLASAGRRRYGAVI